MPRPIKTRGSISGFTQITMGSTEQETNRHSGDTFSLAYILKRVQDLNTVLDAEVLQDLTLKLLEHVEAHNPHKLSADEIDIDVIDEFFKDWIENYYTGTDPVTPDDLRAIIYQENVIASDADLEDENNINFVTVKQGKKLVKLHEDDPFAHAELIDQIIPGSPPESRPNNTYHPYIGHINLVTTRASKETYVDVAGVIRTSPTNTASIKYYESKGFLSLYGSNVNRFDYFNPNNNLSIEYLGSTKKEETTRIYSPDESSFYVTVIEDNTFGLHGFSIPVYYPANTEVVLSAHILPDLLTKKYQLYVDSRPDIAVIFDPQTGQITSSDPNEVYGYVEKYNTGWYRIFLHFMSQETTNSTFRIIAVDEYTLTPQQYTGNGRRLFSVWGLSNSLGTGYIPIIYTNGVAASNAITTAVISGLNTLNRIQGIIASRFIYDRSRLTTERTLFSILDFLTVSIVNDNIKIVYQDMSNTQTILLPSKPNELDVIAISYERGKLIVKNRHNDRVTIVLAPGELKSTAELNRVTFSSSVTPLSGYIGSFLTYPKADDDQTLEYFTGGF